MVRAHGHDLVPLRKLRREAAIIIVSGLAVLSINRYITQQYLADNSLTYCTTFNTV